jgi:hypothetical protein
MNDPNSIYKDYNIIFITRNPWNLFTSVIKAGDDPLSHETFHLSPKYAFTIEEYFVSMQRFIEARDGSFPNIYTIKYEELFDDDFSKIKSIGKQNENSLFKEERFIKLYNSCYELLKIQIELSVKYSKLRNKNSILSNALLDRDWVYGYICGYVTSCFDNSYLKNKEEIYSSVICGILHLLGIRGSKIVKEHISTVIWCQEYCCYYLYDGISNHRMRDDMVYEVIGNFFDNKKNTGYAIGKIIIPGLINIRNKIVETSRSLETYISKKQVNDSW